MRYQMKLKLTHDEVSVLVFALSELVVYAESVAGEIAGKTKKKFDECIFMHTMRHAKPMRL